MKRAAFPLKRPVMLITDYPLQNEIDRDIPYSGASNLELLGSLAKARIMQKEIGFTYLSYERPEGENYDFCKSFCKQKDTVGSPLNWHKLEHQKDVYIEEELWNNLQNLLEEIRLIEPKMIIIAGKWSFFLLTGLFTLNKTLGGKSGGAPLGGLSKYRASICKFAECFNMPETLLFPILPAATKHRQPELAPIITWDSLKAGDIFTKLAKQERSINDYLNPNYSILFGTAIDIVNNFLSALEVELEGKETKLSVDIETRHNTIDCLGLGYQKGSAICIPFSTIDNPIFWKEEEEVEIVLKLLKIFNHPNCRIVGQNFSYDAQFLYKFWLGKFHASLDTMIANHVLHNKMKKSLDILASIYCEDYVYWKDMQDHSLEGVNK